MRRERRQARQPLSVVHVRAACALSHPLCPALASSAYLRIECTHRVCRALRAPAVPAAPLCNLYRCGFSE